MLVGGDNWNVCVEIVIFSVLNCYGCFCGCIKECGIFMDCGFGIGYFDGFGIGFVCLN